MEAATRGRVLILEGIEKAERNVLPVLNNLLENREMQLNDGRFLMAAPRYDKLLQVSYHTHGTWFDQTEWPNELTVYLSLWEIGDSYQLGRVSNNLKIDTCHILARRSALLA